MREKVRNSVLYFLKVIALVFASTLVMAEVEENSVNSGVLAESAFIGIIKPRQIIKVGSPVTGIVESIFVDRGAVIKLGQRLVRLNSEAETVDVELAEARYQFAQSRFDRQAQLQRQALTSEADVEQAEMELKLSELERNRRAIFLKQRNIQSPATGVVTHRLVSKGEYIYEQTPVLILAQNNPLNVEMVLPLSEYGKVTKGMSAYITPQSPIGGQYLAEVEVVDSVMDAASSTFSVRLILPNDDLSIPSGIQCSVRFVEPPLIGTTNSP